ncbi:amino acid adenylation domain-containing protein [Micromonospora sp. WMMD1076]|uniref:non-ribosomal peptide synthetase n=1 Tax=Micromonospora sp. WMMD1076 TaxID=3016103 RepID=UPI00249A2672|nr:non-ribosomal peptide synthetase [Micromonospora sp. WMMD1076]WFF05904.1 amino acid adenylation domain-containing protein [Micromonospora sp. WMMD1076]
MAGTADIAGRRAALNPARAELLRRWTAGRAGSAGIPRLPDDGPAVLAYSQERLWLLDRFLGGGSAYNTIPLAVRLRGPLDPQTFRRSLAEVVRRHEIMRTRFTTVGGEPRQVVLPDVPVAVELVDLHAEPDPPAAAERFVAEHRADTFDLAGGPLFRTWLLRLGGDEHLLLHLTHHIISDGWSDDVLVREIATIYQALADGGESPLPPLPVQYRDFAAWQRERLSGERLERLLGHWRDRLGDAPRTVELPTDHPRPAVQRLAGITCPVRIPATTTRALRAVARAGDATLFMVVLTAVDVLLARYSGQNDIVVGTPVAGRTTPETEALIGCFINTLVLRTDLSGHPTFRQAVARVRQVALAAYANQELPFERLVELLQPDRDTSRNPLFQVMFALQNSPPTDQRFGPFTLSPVELDNGVAKFDLTIDLREFDGELVGRLQFDSDLFDPATCERMTRHFTTLLTAVAQDPDQAVSDLPLLDAAEAALVTGEWNATEVAHELESLHRLVERAAARWRDTIAVSAPDGQLTYRELNRRADLVARALREAGVGPDTLVALFVDRSVALPVGILGILKAGAAYVPLDPTHPADRIAAMLSDAAVAAVLTTGALRDVLPAQPAPVLAVDALPPASGTGALPDVPLDALAYVIYTSGSTGRPKGVMISHRAVANMIRSTLDDIGVDPGDAVLQYATVCFDVSVLEIFIALCGGTRLVIPDSETVLNPHALTRLVQAEQVTVFDIPPAVLELLDADATPSLRVQFIGCEAFGGPLATRWQRPWRRLINGYGPTEATVMMTLMELDRPYDRMPPIGTPMPNHQAYVLDERLHPVPVGVGGELYIGGTGLARGYLHRPGLTADRFVPDPFARHPGGRLYRTGDLAAYRADGVLSFLGRVDRQVKIRGYRIEIGEIEATLGTHPLVGQAVVAVRGDSTDSKHLVAYVQPAGAAGFTSGEIRDWLGRLLPAYLVPQVIVPIDALPLLPSGKVDRAALPDPATLTASRPDEDRPAATARTAMQRRLVEDVFGPVLGVADLDVRENFFQLGGNSLHLAALQSRIAEVLGVEVPLRTLFQMPSVAALATHLEGRSPHAERARQPRDDDPERFPLTPQQVRLWEQAERTGWYNKPLAARLIGIVDPEAVLDAVRAVVRRHEPLRTTVDAAAGEPQQVVHAELEPAVDMIDVGEAAIAEVVAAEVRRPFDLARGPMVRAVLLRLSDYDHVLVVTAHPLAWDGASRAVLGRELLVLGDAADAGGPLPQLTVRYRDHARRQRDWLAGPEAASAVRRRRDRLAGAPGPLRLPGRTGGAQTWSPGGVGAARRFTVPGTIEPRLRALQDEAGVTPFVLLFAAFAVTLHRLTGGVDLVVGVPMANRVEPGTAALVGHFVNTLPLRVDLGGDPTFGEVLRRVNDAVVDAYADQRVPLSVVPGVAPSPVTFDLLTDAAGLRPAPGVAIGAVDVDTGRADVELAMAMELRSDGLHGTVTHATDVYPAEVVHRLIEEYRAVLAAVAADPAPALAAVARRDPPDVAG